MPAYPAGPTRVVLARPRRHHRRLVVDLPPPDAGVEHPRRLPNTLLVWTTMVAAHRGGRTGAGFLRGFTPVDTTQRGWISTGVPCWFRGRHPRWTPTRVGRVTTRVGRLTPWVGVTHPARKTYLATRWRRRRVWTVPGWRTPGGYRRVRGWGFNLETYWIPRETWVPDPARDFEITKVHTRRWRMGVTFPDCEFTYLRTPGGRRGVPPRRWRGAPTVPDGGPIPRGWYSYLRPTRRYLRWSRQRSKWRGTTLPGGPTRVVWSAGVPPLVSSPGWRRICKGFTPTANPVRRRPRWWWRRGISCVWDRHGVRATTGVPRWWRGTARHRAVPRRWVHRWNTTVGAALQVGVGLTRVGVAFPTVWTSLKGSSRSTRRVTRTQLPTHLEWTRKTTHYQGESHPPSTTGPGCPPVGGRSHTVASS